MQEEWRGAPGSPRRRAPSSEPAARRGRACGVPGAPWSPGRRRHHREDRPGPAGRQRSGLQITASCGLTRVHSWAEASRSALPVGSPGPPVVRPEHPSPRGGCRGPPRFRLLPGPISGARPPSAPPPPPPPRCCPGPAACPGHSAARSPPSRRYGPRPGPRRVRNPPVGGRAAWGQRRGAPARPDTKGTGTQRPRAGWPRAAVALGPSGGAQWPLAFPRQPAPCPPLYPTHRAGAEQPRPPRLETQSLGGGATSPPTGSWGPSLPCC